MRHTFWLDVPPGFGEEHFEFVAEKLKEFLGLNF